MTDAFSALGKQVLVDGTTHYADARDPEAAETIARALNAMLAFGDELRAAAEVRA